MHSVVNGSATRAAAAVQTSNNPSAARPGEAAAPLPSSFAPPTVVDDLPQQAATQPGTGSNVHAGTDSAGQQTECKSESEVHPRDSGEKKVPFKEQVIGVAQKTRGTLFGKPELKEHGEKILEGQTTHEQDK